MQSAGAKQANINDTRDTTSAKYMGVTVNSGISHVYAATFALGTYSLH
jgi:hypothetical protein